MSLPAILQEIENGQLRQDIPLFRTGDTIRVHAKIVEGTKERVQIFEGVVIKKSKKDGHANATFTVRKVSYNVGVERTFLLHSTRIERIEIVRQGHVRRSRLFYLRPLRGKAARIKTKVFSGQDTTTQAPEEIIPVEEPNLDPKKAEAEETGASS